MGTLPATSKKSGPKRRPRNSGVTITRIDWAVLWTSQPPHSLGPAAPARMMLEWDKRRLPSEPSQPQRLTDVVNEGHHVCRYGPPVISRPQTRPGELHGMGRDFATDPFRSPKGGGFLPPTTGRTFQRGPSRPWSRRSAQRRKDRRGSTRLRTPKKSRHRELIGSKRTTRCWHSGAHSQLEDDGEILTAVGAERFHS